MTVSTFLKQTATLVLWAIGIEAAAFYYDLFFHAKVSNPFWDQSYNWLPIIVGILVGAVAITLLRHIATGRRMMVYKLGGYTSDQRAVA